MTEVKVPARATARRVCKAPDCIRSHYSLGFCKKHYTQVFNHGHLTPDRERGSIRVCAVEACGRIYTIRGYCQKHARQLRVHGRLTPEREHVYGVLGCRAHGCNGEHKAKGFCIKHYNQQRWARIAAEKKVKSGSRGKKAAKR